MGFLEGLTAALAAKFLFFPLKTIEFYPSQLEIPYEDVRFREEGGKEEAPLLHGWFFPGKKDRTLLYLHGNAGNIGDRLDKIQFLKRIGWGIFTFDYRGYGGSEGVPTIEGVLEDAETAFHYLVKKRNIQLEQITLFGESLGGALAVHLATQEPVGSVILEGTFSSLRQIAASAYPFIPSLLVPDVYRSSQLVRHLKCPLLVIHGTEDEVVPFKMGKEIFDAAPHPKQFYPVSGAHHNDTYVVGNLGYLEKIEGFLSSVGLP